MQSIKTRFSLVGQDLEIHEQAEIILDEASTIVEIVDHCSTNSNLIAVPGFYNAHVHAADIGIRGQIRDDLYSVVGPGGVKSRYLSSLSKKELQKNITQAINEGKKNGVLGFADFREAGIEGLQSYQGEASSYLPLLRPLVDEIDIIIALKDEGNLPKFSIGIRDVVAYPEDKMKKLAQVVHSIGGRVEIHVSEDIVLREKWFTDFGQSDIDWALDIIEPHAIVHATLADETDLDHIIRHNTGVILCPISNQYFNVGRPPVELFLDHNIPLGLGSDNAMVNTISLNKDMQLLKQWGIESKEIVKMATVSSAAISGKDWGIAPDQSNIQIYDVPKSINVNNIYDFLISKDSNKFLIDIISNQNLMGEKANIFS